MDEDDDGGDCSVSLAMAALAGASAQDGLRPSVQTEEGRDEDDGRRKPLGPWGRRPPFNLRVRWRHSDAAEPPRSRMSRDPIPDIGSPT